MISPNQNMPQNAPDMAAPAPAAPISCYLTLPLSALAQPGQDDQMNAPAEGDKSSANIDFTVDSIDGENATICVNAVNGNEIESPDENADEAPDTESSEDAQEGSDLRQMALNQ